MPAESRIVRFTDKEILEAVTAYCVKTARLAPGIRVTSPLVSNDGEIKLSFEPVPAGPIVTLHESELLSAIILYCNQRHIPISRRSVKSLSVTKNSFSLHMETPT